MLHPLFFRTVFVFLVLAMAACAGSTKKTASVKEKAPYPKNLPAQLMPGDSAFAEVESVYIKGIGAFEMGDYDNALDLLLSVYIKVPQFAGVNYALADCYLKLQDLDNATFYGLEAAKIEPENKYFRLKLAEIYASRGNLEGTIDQLQKARKSHPKDLEILFNLSNAYAAQNKLLESNAVIGSILKITGDDLQLRAKRFAHFNELGMKDSAVTELKRMQKMEPENTATLQTLAQFQIEQKDKKGARKTLRQVLRIEPGNTRAMVNLADLFIQESQWDSAGAILKGVITDSLMAAQNKLEIVQFMYSRYSDQKANAQLEAATADLVETFLKMEPGFGLGYAVAADFYITAGKAEKALKALEKTTELMPQNDNAWRTRAQFLYQEGLYEDAVRVGKEADGIFPDDPFIQFFIGASYFLQNQRPEALHWLRSATNGVARDPFKSVIWGMIGDVHAAADEWAKADSAYDKALKLDPENENVLNNFAYYLSERDMELDKAEQMGLKAVSIDPKNAAYLDTIGWVYFKKKDFKKALEYIQKAVNTGDASATVLEHLGDCYEKLGKMTEAKMWWKKALEKDSSRGHLQPKL
jgi:tetratricopeptide (TPR) repeat protein